MEELIKSLRGVIRERLSSPLAGAFLLSWSAVNFKVFLIALGDAELDSKLKLFDQVVLNQPYPSWHLFWLPLLGAVLFVAAYPVPALFAYWYWALVQNKLKEIRKGVEDKAPLTREQEKRIRSDMEKLVEESEKEQGKHRLAISAKDKRIEELLGQLDEAQKVVDASKPDSSPSNILARASIESPNIKRRNAKEERLRKLEEEDIDRSDIDFMTILSTLVDGGGEHDGDFGPEGREKVYVDSILDKLAENQYLIISRMGNQVMGYRLTERGRQLAVDLGITMPDDAGTRSDQNP